MPTIIETSLTRRPSIESGVTTQTGPSETRPISEERLLAYSLFGAGFVHEVNSPLATALLSAQVALRSLSSTADPRARRCLAFTMEGIETAAQAMRRILRHCNDHEAQRCQFDVCDVLRFTTAAVMSFADRCGCRFDWDACASPADVIGNPIELQFALADVLYGAIARGARMIAITTTTDDEWLRIVIVDDFPRNPSEAVDAGLPDHEPHEGPTDPRYVHALLRELIHANGGSIEHNVNPKVGHSVTISLPRRLT
jgi:signal transduction histidine kinase